jgi:hypothetical protein
MGRPRGSDEELVQALEGLLSLARELHRGVHVCDSGCEDAFEAAEFELEKRGRRSGQRRNCMPARRW